MTARVETGPTQFGNDWPGLFIRGDDALALAMYLRDVLRAFGDSHGTMLAISTMYATKLAEMLESVNAANFPKESA